MSLPTDLEDILRRLEELEARLGGDRTRERGAELSSELSTGRLIIGGRAGRPVIEMAASPEGEPEIVLSDAAGRERVLLRIVDDECALEFLDGDGGTRLRIASSDRTTRIVLWPAAESARRLELRVAADGSALLSVPEGTAASRVRLGVDGAGHAVVTVAPAGSASGEGDAR